MNEMVIRARRLALVTLAALLAPLQQGAAAAQTGPRANTASGAVEGVALPSGVQHFRGIPFAAPPVRELRWKPPQPVAGWEGVRPADRYGPMCMQGRPFSDMVFRAEGMSEDCLYLNVWTPSLTATGRLPVLVYIYGGGFFAGDGSEPRYDGENMARKGMVVVTMNYRLGTFGFFSHPELTAESPHRASGNYGLMDQAAALEWVRRNVAAFGGDPARVTIAGESAGSFSVSAQMASPLAKHLIAGAIGESGAFLSSTSLPAEPRATTEQTGARFAQTIGAPSLAALRALSALEILDASARQGAPRFAPNVDGYFFTEPPAATYAAGRQARVPLLAGWNSEESFGRSLLQDPTPAAWSAVLEREFGPRAAEARRVLPGATAEEAAQSATDLASDRFIGFGTWRWLEEQARAGAPVYRYLYARPRPPMRNPPPNQTAAAWPVPRGAAHSAEIEYAMGNLDRNPVWAWTAEDREVSRVMQEYFANFVKTGNPNGPGLPAWPRGEPGPDGRVTRMRIDAVTRAEPEPRERYLFLGSVWK